MMNLLQRLIASHFRVSHGPGELKTCPRCGGAGFEPNEEQGAADRFYYERVCKACRGAGTIERSD